MLVVDDDGGCGEWLGWLMLLMVGDGGGGG